MGNRGSLIVISGFSGVGKGTVMEYLKNNYDNYEYLITDMNYLYQQQQEVHVPVKNMEENISLWTRVSLRI